MGMPHYDDGRLPDSIDYALTNKAAALAAASVTAERTAGFPPQIVLTQAGEDPVTYTVRGGDLTNGHEQIEAAIDTGLAFLAAVASISSPAASSITSSGATLGCTTNKVGGTLYVVVETTEAALDTVTAEQIVAGQDDGGGAVVASGNAVVASLDASKAITGLTTGTVYYYAMTHNRTEGNSNVLRGSFTTL